MKQYRVNYITDLDLFIVQYKLWFLWFNGRFFNSYENANQYKNLLEEKERVFAHAVDVFGNKRKAKRWFKSSIKALNYRSPANYMNSPEGIVEVDNILYRIEHGIYS